MRAKRGAAPAVNEGETIGEMEIGLTVVKTETTVAGTGDKIWFCEIDGTVAASGCEAGAGADLQQAIFPPQPQSLATGLVAGTAATATWPQRSNRLQKMVSASFTMK